jgi:hypothetical protein
VLLCFKLLPASELTFVCVDINEGGWLYWLQLQAQVSDDHLLLRKLQEEEGHTKEVLEQELHKQRQHIAHLNDSHHEVMAKITVHADRISVRSLKVYGLYACGLLP